MRLLTERLGPIEDVTAEQIEAVLSAGAYGHFLVLADGDGFIQFGYGDLEYCDRQSGRMFRVDWLTREQVRLALLDYLAGGIDWRNFDWREFDL
jgi:hypothetical protein